jgi:hypothetical protein
LTTAIKKSNMRGSKKVPGILWHRRLRPPWVRTAWIQCYSSFLRSSFAGVTQWSSLEAARQLAETAVSATG